MRSIIEEPLPGGWTERKLVMGGREFAIILPLEPDKLLDALPETWEAGDHPLDPYWAKLWPAAIELSEQVIRNAWRPNARVLELGAGIGVVGLAALSQGCCVTFSDMAPLAVDLSLENATRNHFGEQAQGLVLDWRAPPALARFPYVVASDVLYYESEQESLLQTIALTLEPNGACWIGDPGRSAAAAFVKKANDFGFSVSICDASGHPRGDPLFGHYQTMVLRWPTPL